MRCSAPYFSTHHGAYACGRCESCLSSRRRTWAGRLILESYAHQSSIFVTLTYSDDRHSLSVKDCQLWLKRVRKRVGKIRVFYCGEYGDATQRPHYHAILFGVPACRGGPVEFQARGFTCWCPTCVLVRETWSY